MKPRAPLLDHMSRLQEQSINCSSCAGECCTFVKNSMQISHSETLTLANYLQAQGLWNEELKKKTLSVIETYRLHKEMPSLGKKKVALRRSYTCPFYQGHSLGCSIPPEVKPLGCLAFNPTKAESKNSEACRSDLESLREADRLLSDEGEKKPIPLALWDWFEQKLPFS